MADSEKKIGTKSVLAFLFMPQFHMSFNHLVFIKPVFMRTIANLFEGAGLLPVNHPATMYGVEGVERYGFRQLMVEVFYNLRENNSSPFQWTLFFSVALMVFIVLGAFVMTALTIAQLLMSPAAAQLFDHPAGNSSMSGYSIGGGNGYFNREVANSGAHADFGIMLLDKVFREGNAGIGGTMQNAFGSLLQVYNSAVLVIAGIMLFWVIISVVVDTAKTGQVGGGRHNMVWAPIRIVFALGLLIPLGSQGFSSGQLMVIKLAEWGSNLGTRAWTTYLNEASGQNLAIKFEHDGAVEKIAPYLEMWVCRVAYNGAAWQSMQAQFAKEQVKAEVGGSGVQFSNSHSKGVCGSIKYNLGSTMSTPVTKSNKAATQFVQSMYKSYTEPFVNISDPTQGGLLEPYAKNLACAIAGGVIKGSSTADGQESDDDPLVQSGACEEGYAEACGASEPGKPDTSCLVSMVQAYYGHLSGSYNSAYSSYQAQVNSSAMRNEISKRGWPAMGIWWSSITKFTQTAAVAAQSPVSITAPSYDNPQGGVSKGIQKALLDVNKIHDKWWESVSLQSAQSGSPTSPTGSTNVANVGGEGSGMSMDGLKNVAMGVVDALPLREPSMATIGIAMAAGLAAGYISDKAGHSATMGVLLGAGATFIKWDELDPWLVAEKVVNAMLAPVAMLLGFGVHAAKTDPLAALSGVGASMQMAAIKGYTLITALKAAPAVMGIGASLVPQLAGFLDKINKLMIAVVEGPVGQLVESISHALMMGSFMYAYYLPMLPVIKVAFAVMTWIVSIFEAVVLIPIAALSHITTEGDGIAPNKQAWVVWLNVLLRPVLTVIGYVGVMIVLNATVLYAHYAWTLARTEVGVVGGGALSVLAGAGFTMVYIVFMYSLVNSSFKLLDIIPSALFKYMGASGDQSFDDNLSISPQGGFKFRPMRQMKKGPPPRDKGVTKGGSGQQRGQPQGGGMTADEQRAETDRIVNAIYNTQN